MSDIECCVCGNPLSAEETESPCHDEPPDPMCENCFEEWYDAELAIRPMEEAT